MITRWPALRWVNSGPAIVSMVYHSVSVDSCGGEGPGAWSLRTYPGGHRSENADITHASQISFFSGYSTKRNASNLRHCLL